VNAFSAFLFSSVTTYEFPPIPGDVLYHISLLHLDLLKYFSMKFCIKKKKNHFSSWLMIKICTNNNNNLGNSRKSKMAGVVLSYVNFRLNFESANLSGVVQTGNTKQKCRTKYLSMDK